MRKILAATAVALIATTITWTGSASAAPVGVAWNGAATVVPVGSALAWNGAATDAPVVHELDGGKRPL